MFASTLTIGSTSAGNSTFLIRLPPEISASGRLEQRRRKPGPRQDAAEHEQRERLESFRVKARHHDGEDERVDRQQQQRVDERPEEAENRAAVARLELARDQALDQPAIAKEIGEVGKQLRADSSASRHLQPDERFQERDARPLDIHVHRRLGEPLLGALLRGLGALDVDLVGLFGDLRQNRDAIGLHLGEAEARSAR